MLGTIKVELVDNGISLSDIFSLVSLVISGISGFWIIWQYVSKKRSEKMRLIVTPVFKTSDTVIGLLFLNIMFSNESSLPISIINMNMYSVSKSDDIPNSRAGFKGGTLLIESVIVRKQTHNSISKFSNSTITLPISISPYGTNGGFFAFNAGESSSELLSKRKIKLEIYTSRGNWEQTINLEPDNFMDFSYDGKTVFGKAVMPITRIQSFRNRTKKFFKL